MVDESKPLERPTVQCGKMNCSDKFDEQHVSLGEAIRGEMECSGCKRLIILEHTVRWDTFDFVDDCIDGLFTPAKPQPIDDNEI